MGEADLRSRSGQLDHLLKEVDGLSTYTDVQSLVHEMKDNLGTLMEVMKEAQACLAQRLANLQEILRKMVIGYPEGTNVEQELAAEPSSSEPVDVDDQIGDDWEVVEEDESLKSVRVDFKEVGSEEFSIQPPSIDESLMSKSEDSPVSEPTVDVVLPIQGETHIKDTHQESEDSTTSMGTSEVDKSITVQQVKRVTTEHKKVIKRVVKGPDGQEHVTEEIVDEGPIAVESYTTSYAGKLKLIIKEGKDLEKKDVVQKADPYVLVKFGSKESKSKKVKNTLNPVWNHEVSLDLERTSPREVEVQLMDWVRFGKDEPMGRAVLPLETLVRDEYKEGVWVDLQACKSGKIFITTEFSGSVARELIGGGVRELRNLLEQGKVQEPVIEESSEGNTFVKNVTKTTTKRTRVVRRVMIGPDGKEHVTEQVVEDPEGLTIAPGSEDIKSTLDNAETPLAVPDQKQPKKEESWRPIPIIRLDQNQLEITELSDEEQEDPMDLTIQSGLKAEPMVTSPSDEEP